MAELSTIARPYAEGLWQALTEHKTSAAKIAKIGQVLESLADMAKDPQVSELVRDPKLTDDQIFEAVTGALGKGLSPELSGLIRVVIENGRLEALPEIAAQYRALKNESEGVADAYIETAFPLDQKELEKVLGDLADRFPGVKLNPSVKVNPALIGGVSVCVGDQILDVSVRARLMQMQAALTA